MARLGVGLLVIPPKPLMGGYFFVDANAERAQATAERYIGAYYGTVIKHYEMDAGRFSYAGMPWDEAEHNMRLFTQEGLPQVQHWQTQPLGQTADLATLAHAGT